MFIWSQWCTWSSGFRRNVATAPSFWSQNLAFQSQNATMRPDFSSPGSFGGQTLPCWINEVIFDQQHRSCSYIVREVHSVREREREKDGSDVTIVALKLAMSFALLLAKNVHLSIGEEFCAFLCQKNCTSVSPLLNGTEFTLSVAKNVALFEAVSILRTNKWRDWQGIEAAKQTIEFPAAPFFFLIEKIEKMNQINNKNYWK